MVQPENGLPPIENQGKFMEILGVGVWGDLGGVFIVNLKKRVAQKRRVIILLHLGFVTISFFFEKQENHSFRWFSVFWTCP